MPVKLPSRVLLTVDAVGGVWHYALALARALDRQGIGCLLAGFGPPPEVPHGPLGLKYGRLVWTDAPLDWMLDDAAPLRHTAATLQALAADWRADLLHLNLPSQAADLSGEWPVVVAAHSCLPTWWDAVRGDAPPSGWQWHRRLNAAGFDRADTVVVPSASHADALARVYGPLGRLQVVHNATPMPDPPDQKEDFVLAAGRWWDDGKNAAVLDRAAAASPWPVLMAGPTTGPNGTHTTLHHARALSELPASDLRRLMRRAAVFAAPSLYEPFGLAVLEAAANGAALVLTDIPTFRELWTDAAVFVPPRDASAYAAAFVALAASPAWRHELAQRARARAARFTPERQTQAMLGVYASAMARQHTPARQVA